MARDSGETRERILASASVLFSAHGYDHVGVREIAARAGVNASLVNRYFGSKEELFTEIAGSAFDIIDEIAEGPQTQWGERLARSLMRPFTIDRAADFDALAFLLRSALSPNASAIVSEQMRVQFTIPLAKRLTGPHARMRASLAASYMIGFATMRFALESPDIKQKDADAIVGLLGAALQQCIDPAR